MSDKKKPNQLIAFASGHRNAILPTFDAYTALFRAQSLLGDVERLSKVYEAAEGENPGGRLGGLKVTDYYAIGFVTCLEWHARSRRADLLNFMPELIQPSMMNNMEAVSQMLSAKVSLADLIGASTKVNNLKDYCAVFNDIWGALKVDEPLKPLLASSSQLGGGESSLFELFGRRHKLVHEINIAQVGSYVLQDIWTFEDAIAHGRMVVDTITKIEERISKFAPDIFPNKLDNNGTPLAKISVLEKQIEDVERRLIAAMQDESSAFPDSKHSWALYCQAQANFIDYALKEIPKRHYDPTPALIEMLYRNRLELLSAIAEELI